MYQFQGYVKSSKISQNGNEITFRAKYTYKVVQPNGDLLDVIIAYDPIALNCINIPDTYQNVNNDIFNFADNHRDDLLVVEVNKLKNQYTIESVKHDN